MPLDQGYGGGSGLSQEQLRNASIIYRVGRSLGASQRDIQIALITALTESNLINVNYGDRDSLGLFQQRAAWGPASVRMDPARSARMFFLGGQAGQRGLFDFKDRNRMGMGEAAQAVQVSAFPDRYATFLPLVQRSWNTVIKAGGGNPLDMDGRPYGEAGQPFQPTDEPDPAVERPQFQELGVEDFSALGAPKFPGLSAPQMDEAGATNTFINEETTKQLKKLVGQNSVGIKGVDGSRAAVIDFAKEMIGTPYVWGGAGPNGVDCSGFLQYVYGKIGVELPRVSYQQANFGKRVGLNKLEPGDLVAWDNSSRNNGADHIAMYIGNGKIIEAAKPGTSVRIRPIHDSEGAWGVKLDY